MIGPGQAYGEVAVWRVCGCKDAGMDQTPPPPSGPALVQWCSSQNTGPPFLTRGLQTTLEGDAGMGEAEPRIRQVKAQARTEKQTCPEWSQGQEQEPAGRRQKLQDARL